MPFGDGTGPLGRGRGGGFGRGRGGGRGFGRGLGRGMGRGLGRGNWNVTEPNPEDYNEKNKYGAGVDTTNKEEELEYLKRRKKELEELLKNLENEIKSREKGAEKRKARVVAEECVGCGICVQVCPENAISMNRVAKINQDLCTGCGDCVSSCPRDAIVLE